MPRPIRYVAELHPVRELSITGTADLAWWTRFLATHDLAPAPSGGQAQILIIAAQGRFMGRRFREVSFCVQVAPPASACRNAAYLLCAFNSSRFFAWCERTFYSTPYHPARIDLQTDLPIASCNVIQNRQHLFSTQLHPPASPADAPNESWNGPVFLPSPPAKRKLFFARILGQARTYPFTPADSFAISPDCPPLHPLLDSGFSPTQWLIRDDATHAKSKTYRRDGFFDPTP